jgi:hypothetical protein
LDEVVISIAGKKQVMPSVEHRSHW